MSGYIYFTDHLGTPQQMMLKNGAMVWKAKYRAFGEIKSEEKQTGWDNPLRFPGQYYDQETELYYNYYRYYDPNSGRYITSDPIGLEGGVNTYLYANSDPINWIDYDGYKAGRNRPRPKGGVLAPDKPNGHGGFHHYGNWGGPGWANGSWTKETSCDWPKRGEPGFKKPVDARDACYYKHDSDICACPKIKCEPDKHYFCLQVADYALSRCLRKAGYSGGEAWSFGTWIPKLIHSK